MVYASLAAPNENNVWIDKANRMCPLTGLRRIRGGGLLADLPFSPYLVPKAPVLDAVRFVTACVLSAKVGVVTG